MEFTYGDALIAKVATEENWAAAKVVRVPGPAGEGVEQKSDEDVPEIENYFISSALSEE